MNINLTMLMQAIGFGLFIWFCAKFVWPPLMRAVETRQRQIAEGLQAGEIVGTGEKFKAETIDQAKVEAQAERERIVAAAKAEAAQEYQMAREQLRNQVADLAVAGAARILQREIDPRAHAQLLDEIRREL